VSVERGRAHSGDTRQVLDPQGFGKMSTKPPRRAANLGEAAIGESDLPKQCALFVLEQTPKYLALDQWSDDGDVFGMIEQAQKARKRLEQIITGLADF
jgi:hypothetical protein